MISLKEFNELPTEAQWNYFWQHEVFLCERRTWNDSSRLYSVHDFYVEIQFDPIWGNATGIFAFKNSCHLDKYVDDQQPNNKDIKDRDIL